MGQTRSKHTREFKIEAVRLLNTSGKSDHEIEADLGIGTGMIYKWRRQLEAEASEGLRAFPGNGNPRDEELTKLRKENAILREKRDPRSTLWYFILPTPAVGSRLISSRYSASRKITFTIPRALFTVAGAFFDSIREHKSSTPARVISDNHFLANGSLRTCFFSR